MKIQIELTKESRDLLVRHFKERSDMHEILERATHNEVAGIMVYVFECESEQRSCSRWRATIAPLR